MKYLKRNANAKVGLFITLALFLIGLLCLATQSPEAAITGLWLPVLFGMAIGVGSDSIQNLRTLKYTHTGALSAGDILVVKGNVLVAVNKTAANVANSFIYRGKVTLPKEANLVVSILEPVYWDNTNSVITKTPLGNTPCGFCTDAAAAADTTITIMLVPNDIAALQRIMTVTSKNTAGAVTYTAAELLGGLILRDPNGGDRSDVTPTAALIVAAIPNCIVGSAFEFTIRNTADAAETITITAGDGVTLSGTMTIAQNNSKRFLAVVTNVGTPAVTLYSLGTVVH